jgi:FemAB-related protein (PEP-CTERM system-associated)
MNIIHCDDSHRDAWNAFVQAASDGSLYHRYEWRDVNQSCFGHRSAYLAAFEQARIVGILPVVQVKSQLFGNIACSLPFVNYGGLCAEREDISQRLLDEGARVADDWGADYLEIRSRRQWGKGLPTSPHKVSMTVQLASDPDVLWKAFATNHRRDIRRGYKRGFIARFGREELFDDFYAVLSESWRDLGTPIYSKHYLTSVLRAFPDATELVVVYAGDEPAAAAFYGFHEGIAEGLWLGSRAKFKQGFVGYVLYWELIRHACERGLVRFHLGRSTANSGAEAFKKQWNAVPEQLYWQYVLRTRKEIPQLNVDNRRYRLAIKTWRKLPVPVTQVIGPLIARSIP